MKLAIVFLLCLALVFAPSGCGYAGAAATYTTVPDEAFQRINTLVEDTFADVAEIKHDKGHLTFYITPKSSFSIVIKAALKGDADALISWNRFVDDVKQLSEKIKRINPNFTLAILDPDSSNTWLLGVNDGSVLVDQINKISPTTVSGSTTAMPKPTTSD